MITLALAAMLVVPVAGSASAGGKPERGGANGAFVPTSLIDSATANPDRLFDVIVQGDKSGEEAADAATSQNGHVKRRFLTVAGAEALVSGKDLLKLARHPHVTAITPNTKVKSASYQDSTMWQDSTDLSILQKAVDPATGTILGPAPQAPAIAIVDSGVEPRADFGARLVASVNLCSLCAPGATGDDEGHGTMVAGIAAGASALYPGGAQNAPIVSIRTADANGQSTTSDVIAAADWIRAHAKEYGIRVANFSLRGSAETSFRFDPLDKAVEALWFDGVVVVAAAGNQGTGTGPVNMSYAPGNDPFVITVGALDQNGTADPTNDTAPSWSAYGTTMDGFSKPDLSAPGRYMVGPVPASSTLATTAPDRIVAPGYMWMSGTSFAAPIVSAAAAQLLARHPNLTPDQVKGALMLAANYLPMAGENSVGVGEIDAGVASTIDLPPNPEEGFQPFIVTDLLTGARSFNEASWASFVATNASWSQASWASASWASASWSTASWASASWSQASWASNVASMMMPLASWAE